MINVHIVVRCHSESDSAPQLCGHWRRFQIFRYYPGSPRSQYSIHIYEGCAMFVSSQQIECEWEYSKDDERVFVNTAERSLGGLSGQPVKLAAKRKNK